MPLVEIRKTRVYEQIVEQIQSMIREKELKVGDKLPAERELADRFGVSRVAVREALSALSAIGVIEIRHGRGSFVKGLVPLLDSMPVSLQEKNQLIEMMEFRKGFEVEAAALASQRVEPEDLEAMERAIELMEADIGSGGLGIEGDYLFHKAVIDATHNSFYIAYYETFGQTINVGMERCKIHSRVFPQRLTIAQLEHVRIMEAIKDGRTSVAKLSMANHLDNIIRKLTL